MKLVDILFVLAVATTANAILIPIDNNGSLQTSRTLSQVSGPTDEPNPGTSNEYQQEPVDLSLPGRIRQQPMDQPNPNTPGPNQRPTVIVFGPNILKQGRKRIIEQPSSSTPSQVHIMNELDSSIFDENWRNILDPIDPSTYNEDWQNIVNQPSSSTSSQVPDPIDQVSPNTFDKYQQQPADKTSSSIPNQTQQQPIDQPSPSTSKRSRKRRIDQPSSDTPKRDRKQPIDQPNPSTSGKYWIPLFVIINLNIPSQDQQQPMNQPIPSTSSQDQQQPMEQDESANTSSNQVIVLSQKYQRTFKRMKKRLEAFKELRDKKWQQYRRYVDLEFKQQMTLAMGKEISGSKYDPNVQKQLKQEYKKLVKKVTNARYELKQFMKKHDLEFDESDPD
ncbi:hypothetical protein QVD99_008677 [Batrachochytrium dendrobatidis]|nr:hypothetical protein QVD99_008677 [Batrachochytrium dendrobatidis]